MKTKHTTRRAASAALHDPADLKRKAALIYQRLKKRHANARIELRYSNPLELLVATILSAQCTDTRVNEATAALFRKYRRPQDYLAVPQEELEAAIRSTGFFRQKARSIRAAMDALLKLHRGEVPRDMSYLTDLPGVGRKTANVILGNVFGIPGIVVDTHVSRISARLGLSAARDPEKIESDLAALFDPSDWIGLSHVLVFHGRYVCQARKPMCEECPVADLCDFYAQTAAPRKGARRR